MSDSGDENATDNTKSLAEMIVDLRLDLKQHVEQVVQAALMEGQSASEESEDDDTDNQGTVAAQLDILTNSKDESGNDFKELTQQFATSEKTSPPIDGDLAKMIDDLINDKLPKAKLEELTDKYCRPENCNNLVAPKTNKAVWNQLKDQTKKLDTGMQKCQKLFLSSVYAILQAARTATGDMKTQLIHSIVLIMSGNREMNLKRREILKPDLNSQFNALCGASTPITTELFGDDMGKQIDEVTKANKLAKKMSGPKKSRSSRFQPYRRNNGSNFQSRNRGYDKSFSKSRPFLGGSTDRRRSGMKPTHTKVNQD